MTRIKIKEGDIFLVPIENFYIAGLITRISSLKVPFGYFYKTKFKEPPKVGDLNFANDNEIILKCKFGVQGFRKQTWKTIGSLKGFERQKWPLPIFYDKSLSLMGELIYLDDNLDELKREKAPYGEENYKNYPDTGLGGSVYIEKKLAKLLLN